MQLPIKSHRGFLNVSRTRFLLSLASNYYMGIIINNVYLFFKIIMCCTQTQNYAQNVFKNSFWCTAGSSGAAQILVETLLGVS